MHQEYHGFLNISNICFKPNHLPQGKCDIKNLSEALLKGFSIIIWDFEAHKYWEVLTSKPLTSNSVFYQLKKKLKSNRI